MSLSSALCALVCLSLAVPLWGEEPTAIPPAVWALKEDPARVDQGAVVLENRIVFQNTFIDYTYRVRILTEKGREAAELRDFPEEAYNIEGRTVHPDGKVVTFNQRKDLTTKALSVGGDEVKQRVLIPPGVTSDCVVEVRWRESGRPLPKRMQYMGTFRLTSAFPTLEAVVKVPLNFPYACNLISRGHTPEIKNEGSYRIFALKDLPGLEAIPYALHLTRPQAIFVAYDMPPVLRNMVNQGPAAFWNHAAKAVFYPYFEREVRKGDHYHALSRSLRKDLAGTPQEQAKALMSRLDAAIRNVSYSTFDEMGAANRKEADEEIDSQDLDAAAKRRRTDWLGMTLLYFHIARDQGLEPKFGGAADRDRRMFSLNSLNVWQFTSYFVVIEQLGSEPLWIEPARRFAPPGMLHQDFQGTKGMIMDLNAGVARQVDLSAQPHTMNLRRYQVEVTPEEGADRFKVRADFQGFPEYAERYRFLALEPKEQARVLRESLEEYMKATTFTRAEVFGAQDPQQRTAWEVEGSIEREEGRRREVTPFPAVPWAIWVPDTWPETRKDLIVIPYLRTFEATSTIHLPEGYTWGGAEPYEQRNIFGTVSWKAEKVDAGTVKVTLQIQVVRAFEAAMGYEALKSYLSWVSEAQRRSLILTRS